MNVLRVVVFLISEYACDGQFGITWGKRTSIDADAKSRGKQAYVYTTTRRRRGVLLASITSTNSSFEEGLSYVLTVVERSNGVGNRAALWSVFRPLFRQVLAYLR